ncbi:hypothetical protein C8T65DRAFT_746770 [Cerioporus squamosus]|nr:hypothetical protein C8T65DRAFT_746770 [Cerioporus squamosus]
MTSNTAGSDCEEPASDDPELGQDPASEQSDTSSNGDMDPHKATFEYEPTYQWETGPADWQAEDSEAEEAEEAIEVKYEEHQSEALGSSGDSDTDEFPETGAEIIESLKSLPLKIKIPTASQLSPQKKTVPQSSVGAKAPWLKASPKKCLLVAKISKKVALAKKAVAQGKGGKGSTPSKAMSTKKACIARTSKPPSKLSSKQGSSSSAKVDDVRSIDNIHLALVVMGGQLSDGPASNSADSLEVEKTHGPRANVYADYQCEWCSKQSCTPRRSSVADKQDWLEGDDTAPSKVKAVERHTAMVATAEECTPADMDAILRNPVDYMDFSFLGHSEEESELEEATGSSGQDSSIPPPPSPTSVACLVYATPPTSRLQSPSCIPKSECCSSPVTVFVTAPSSPMYAAPLRTCNCSGARQYYPLWSSWTLVWYRFHDRNPLM